MNEIEVISPEAAENLTELLAALERGEQVHGVIEPTNSGYRIKPVAEALSEVDRSLKLLLPAGSASAQSSDPMVPEHYREAVRGFEPLNEVLGMSLRVLQILTDGKVTVGEVSYNIGRPLRKRNNLMPHQGKLESLQGIIRGASEYYARRQGVWEKRNKDLYAEQTVQLKKGYEASRSAENTSLNLIAGYEALHKGLESFEDGWLAEAAGILGSEPDISDVFETINRKETEAREQKLEPI